MNTNSLLKQPARPGVQRGAALVTGLLIATVLSIVGVNASTSSVTQSRMANNYRFSIEAMNSAEVGTISAIDSLNDLELVLNGFDDELDANADGIIGDRFSLTLADASSQIFYTAVVVDDDDGDADPAVDANGIVRLLSQGTSDLGSTRTIELRIADPNGLSSGGQLDKAVLAEDSITLSGSTEYYGSHTDIHSNENLYQTDHPYNPGTLSASGTAYGGAPEGGGQAISNAPVVDIPDIVPGDFERFVDYVFNSDGRIYDANGNFVADADGTAWNGWKFAGDKWTTEGDFGVVEGDLYFKGQYGNVSVASNPGTASDPWEISILADGYIELAGTPIIANYIDPDDPVNVQNILFVAGTDIKINGNVNQTFRGLIWAAEQFMITGNPSLEGAIVSGGQDNSATNNSDLVAENTISGSAVVNYDGGLRIPIGGGAAGIVTVLSWREREIARNSGAFAPQS